MSSHEKLHKTYKSRKNLLAILKRIGYDTTDYENFDENEIHTLLETNQLDMILYKNGGDDGDDGSDDVVGGGRRKKDNRLKTYVKYNINTSKINCDQNFLPRINEFYEQSDDASAFYLNRVDTLIMVVDTEITDKIQERLKNIYENYGHFVVIHNIARLQYNILNHCKNPKSFHVLSEKEMEEFKQKHYIDDFSKIPEISRFDPYALAICLKPGEVCKVTRTSVNSLDYDSWVYCV
jgi:DNA-directed RNA polymerase subunit H (RpoH/RPB5)